MPRAKRKDGQLGGVHIVTKTLASGVERKYRYAWRGGPRLTADPSSKEYEEQWRAALAKRAEPDKREGTLAGLIAEFRRSTDYSRKKPRTQKDYDRLLPKVEAEFGAVTLRLLSDQRLAADILEWRDGMAATPRAADALFVMLSTVLSFGVRRQKLTRNICSGGGTLYKADRTEKVWTETEIAKVLKVAPPHVADATVLALWTGQRQGDVLSWTWDAYDGTSIRRRQGKRGARVAIPVGGPLRDMLERRKAGRKGEAPTILVNARGQSWTSDGFRSSWHKAIKDSGVTGKTFNDLRGTAVTRLALAGCTVSEIASITGHSSRTVSQMLDAHYLGERSKLAEQGMARLYGRTDA
ncbi:integrase family protein [Stappia sp. 22II-S9-Z10]|nr:integrase family protein [Stappia sp. 22II-S9-Z10]